MNDEQLKALCREAWDEPLGDASVLRMRREFAKAMDEDDAPPQVPQEIMTLHEVARLLRTTPEEVDCQLADVPCFELGGRILFRREAVMDWIARREQAFAVDLLASELRTDLHVPAL